MNQTSLKDFIICTGISILFVGTLTVVFAQSHQTSRELDAKVEKFLNENRGHWQDWNVPYEDGKVLFNLIIKKNYTRALEIGTSTGHSAIWIAWALSKTGGKLITIEIDEMHTAEDHQIRNNVGIDDLALALVRGSQEGTRQRGIVQDPITELNARVVCVKWMHASGFSSMRIRVH